MLKAISNLVNALFPTTITVNSASDALRITQTGSGNAFVVEDSSTPDASPFVITADGKVGIGGLPTVATSSLNLASNITGNSTSYSQTIQGIIQSDVTTVAGGVRSILSTEAAAFVLTNLRHFQVNNVSIGAGSAVTNQVGYYVSPLTSATNNYGFYSDVASGTGRWNFYANGTADNFFGGSVGIGGAPNASSILDVQSTTKGVRMPNMTSTQKNSIASPAAGLMIFDTTLSKLCVYTGAAWQTITSA